MGHVVAFFVCVWIAQAAPIALDPAIASAEADRIAMIARVTPSVVAIFPEGGNSGGTAVIVSTDGFALTNYHVTAGSAWFLGGFSDGSVYPAIIVGFDPVGDLALVKFVGKDDFVAAEFGDSDQVRIGENVYALGNPFLLATDFTPTVSRGIISGIHRYQGPTGGVFEYTDCLQTDAAVNPGNSGGPLFNEQGKLVGINGRISPDKRGRLNVGVAYAISARQAQNFLPLLRGGLIAEHAALGAVVQTEENGRTVITALETSSDTYRQGFRIGDQVTRFADRTVTSANDLKNVLGILPKGWNVDLLAQRGQEKILGRVRLEALTLPKASKKAARSAPPNISAMPLPLRPLYEPREGFANNYFQKQMRDRLLQNIKPLQAPAKEQTWKLKFQDDRQQSFELLLQAQEAVLRQEGADPIVFRRGEEGEVDFASPAAFLVAVDLWKSFRTTGESWFSRCDYAGGFPSRDGSINEALETERAGIEARWLFGDESSGLVGMEIIRLPSSPRCEIAWKGETRFADFFFPLEWHVHQDGQAPRKAVLIHAERSP